MLFAWSVDSDLHARDRLGLVPIRWCTWDVMQEWQVRRR
jgi:hypothetical protein